MNCQESRELFPEYLGKEMSKQQSRELAHHLKECRSCREDLASLSRVQAVFQAGWPDEEIPRSLILETAGKSSQKLAVILSPRFWPRGLLVSAVATICFILCVSTLALLRTDIELKDGHFRVSFNRFSPTSNSYFGTTPVPSAMPATLNQSQLEKIIQDALAQSEQRQSAKVEKLLLDTKAEINTTRSDDMQKVSQGLKYLEMTQAEVWKASARNASYLESLAREVYVKASTTN